MPVTVSVTADHIAAAPIGSGTNPINLALQEQLGPTWIWLGGNQVRNFDASAPGSDDLQIYRVPKLADGRKLNNVMKPWFRGSSLEPFEFVVPIDGDDTMAFMDFTFDVKTDTRLEVRPKLSQSLLFDALGVKTYGVYVKNTTVPPREVALVGILAARSGPHADKITVNVQGTLTIPPDGEVELDLTVELFEMIPEGEAVDVRVVGEESGIIV
jgi:hypothetical protein